MANPFKVGSATVTGSGTSRAAAVASATGSGDTITVSVVVNNTTCIPSACADSKGNIYTLDKSFTSASPTLYMYRSPGATGGSGGGATAALTTSDTVTVTTNAVSGNVEVFVTSAPGVGALDAVTNIASGTSTTPSVSGTPSAGNDTCIAAFATANAGGAPTVNSPFTSLGSQQSGSDPYDTVTYETGAANSAQTETLTIVSANWRAGMWLFLGPSATSAALTLAQETVAALAPTAGLSIALTVAQEAISAPAPTVTPPPSPALPTARVTITAPAPAVSIPVTILLPIAQEAVRAPAPSIPGQQVFFQLGGIAH
jgi:hypothetical protein